MITDHQRFEFMMKLAASMRDPKGILLPTWESNFVASFCQSSRRTLWFTLGRRSVTDRIWMRYGPDIGCPHPLDTVTERPKIAAADPDGCEYLVREDGRPSRCNLPAEVQEPGKLRYCRSHGEQVERDLKRAGKRIALIKFP